MCLNRGRGRERERETEICIYLHVGVIATCITYKRMCSLIPSLLRAHDHGGLRPGGGKCSKWSSDADGSGMAQEPGLIMFLLLDDRILGSVAFFVTLVTCSTWMSFNTGTLWVGGTVASIKI